MRIQHIRNATMVVETGDQVILVDPMLGRKGTMPPFSFIKSKPIKNPTVPLPDNCQETLERVTHCLITHRHPDHIDLEAKKYLVANEIPVVCSVLDEKALKKQGLEVTQTVEYWEEAPFLGGKIVGIPARHGYGFVTKLAGNVMGFFIDLPNHRSIYLSSDTIYTDDVDKVLKEHQPEISVVAAGSAQFDIFKPLLMTIEDVVRFIHNAPGKVIANHMEAVNHCLTSRADLRKKLIDENLKEKVYIPEDGDWLEFE